MDYVIPIITLGVLGFLFGVGLAYALKLFAVVEDPMIGKIAEVLPGTNCGACGFAGCKAYAEALVQKETEMSNLCKPGASEVAKAIAELLGIEFKECQKTLAVVHCGADSSQRKIVANYEGYQTCKAASMVSAAGMGCSYGCIGLGDCQKVCSFGAINMVNGLPIIDVCKCTSCGKCVEACPRAIIKLKPVSDNGLVEVLCNSRASAKEVRDACSVGCIACKICEKLTNGAFTIKDNLALTDSSVVCDKDAYNKGIEKCPRKIIKRII